MEMKVRLTLTEEALGMMPASREIHEQYIASKSPDAVTLEEEVDALGVDEVVERTMTIFPRTADGVPFFWDYQVRGMIKDSIGMLRRVKSTKCAKVSNYKKVVDGLIFVNERKIPIHVAGEMGDCQRPLRADTMQGQRVALAHSETVPAGSWIEFTINMLDDGLQPVIEECLDYGRLRGLGQWRNSGCGRYTWERVG